MRLSIRSKAAVGFIVTLLAGMLTPQPAAAVEVPWYGVGSGEFAVSLAAGRFTAMADGKAGHLGRGTFEIVLDLAPSPAGPLSREVSGDVIFTSPSGDELFMHLTGTITYNPNARRIDGSADIEVVGGTGRFARALGFAPFNIHALVDDSGVAGMLWFDFDGRWILP